MIEFAQETLTIAVDFDGTIVEHKFPEIGEEMLFAFDTLKALRGKGHRLILWTFRHGKALEEAVEFCRKNGVEFYAVNASYPEEVYHVKEISRKIDADLFIDDRNLGGFHGWDKIWKMLYPDGRQLNHQLERSEAHHNHKKKSFFAKIFRK